MFFLQPFLPDQVPVRSENIELLQDDALIVYEGGQAEEAQCTAPPGPVLVKDVVAEIGHDVSEEARNLRPLSSCVVFFEEQIVYILSPAIIYFAFLELL